MAEEKRVAEQKLAEEKRAAEQKLAKEKRVAEQKLAEEKRTAEQKLAKEKRAGHKLVVESLLKVNFSKEQIAALQAWELGYIDALLEETSHHNNS